MRRGRCRSDFAIRADDGRVIVRAEYVGPAYAGPYTSVGAAFRRPHFNMRSSMIRNATRLAAVLLATGLIWATAPYDAPQAQAPAGGGVAFTGATVIDGTGAAPMTGATIVVSDGRIQAVGRNVTVPAGATRVDMPGKFITPGLVNAHGHLQADMSKRPARDRLAAQLRMYADYGITTVQVLGLPLDDVPDGIKLRDESRPGAGGSLDRARVLIAAARLRNPQTAQEARGLATEYADMKVDIIKRHIHGSRVA